MVVKKVCLVVTTDADRFKEILILLDRLCPSHVETSLTDTSIQVRVTDTLQTRCKDRDLLHDYRTLNEMYELFSSNSIFKL